MSADKFIQVSCPNCHTTRAVFQEDPALLNCYSCGYAFQVEHPHGTTSTVSSAGTTGAGVASTVNATSTRRISATKRSIGRLVGGWAVIILAVMGGFHNLTTGPMSTGD